MKTALVLLGLTLAARAEEPRPVPSPLWDDVLHPDRLRCAQLVVELRFGLDSARVPPEKLRISQLLERAARRCPRNLDVQSLYGESLIGIGEHTAALKALEHARQLAPAGEDRDPRLAFHLGFVRALAGDLEGSLREYQRAQALGGLGRNEEWLLAYDLGDTLMALGRLAEAIESYRRVVRQVPTEPVPRLALAVALDRDQQIEKSKAELTVALQVDPSLRKLLSGDFHFVPRDEIHYYLALIAFHRGKIADAQRELETFLAALPESPYALRARQHLQNLN
jgi:tetratricopeptide (TPR) repeat protein